MVSRTINDLTRLQSDGFPPFLITTFVNTQSDGLSSLETPLGPFSMAPLEYQVPDRHYIPVGCLNFSSSHLSVLPLQQTHLWCQLSFEVRTAQDGQPPLSRGIDDYLLACIQPFHLLLQKQWIRLRFRQSIDDPDQIIMRVYLLPDDVEGSHVDRSPRRLRMARIELLSMLDYSSTKWEGRVGSCRVAAPLHYDERHRVSDHDEPSLLELFNNLPRPNPRLDKISDPYARYMATNLLENDELPGLHTKLYPYQKRSVIMMIQKEYQTEQVLDPRYAKVIDQDGNPWYYDSATGVARLEPLFYDSSCGGILAEEMGSGKTVMCLALILATRHQTSKAPDTGYNPIPYCRKKIGSLADMAAAVATQSASPWRLYFDEDGELDYSRCLQAIRRNPGYYHVPVVNIGRSRSSRAYAAPKKIYLSHGTLVIVPPNLIKQWKQEIAKHTKGLKFISVDHKQEPPTREEVLEQDLILFSRTVFEKLYPDSSLTDMHFKRCIVDEGHSLGNSNKTDLQRVLDTLHITARWVVSGTPAKGLYGIDHTSHRSTQARNLANTSLKQEANDLRRIGEIATRYLKVRPFANTSLAWGDTAADWSTYVLQPRHSGRSSGRQDCLRSVLSSLIIRHRSDEHARHLPKVNERVVFLEGCYQDKLCLNLFSMMIIFNAVQSERKDQDYFFHERQRRALTELVSNLKQASFFGGGFFPTSVITDAITNAEKFLEEGKVQVSEADKQMLCSAITFGNVAARNHIKQMSSTYQMVPIYVKDFPGRPEDRRSWSLDLRPDDPVCTNSDYVGAMQRFLRPMIDAPFNLELKFNKGEFMEHGNAVRKAGMAEADTESGAANSPAAAQRNPNTNPATRMSKISLVDEDKGTANGVADALLRARIVSTASAKMTYLIEQVVQYQQDEQIIIFYEHDNTAYYISGMLEMLQIQHLIYSNRLKSVERRAQYIDTFNYSTKFRVMLMDIRCAAFGLDLRNASRIYFLHPVLDSQVEAQAIGRARRICMKKDVTVETLVLKDSFEAFLVERRGEMSAGEQRQCKTILDDKPIKRFIENAKLIPLPDVENDGPSQTALLEEPQFLFGRTFARAFISGLDNPDEDLVDLPSPRRFKSVETRRLLQTGIGNGTKDDRPLKRPTNTTLELPKRKRVAFDVESEAGPRSAQEPVPNHPGASGTNSKQERE